MKAVILCAGYAVRLYPLTLNTPKPLLKVAGKTILNHIIEKIKLLPEINDIYIITNHRFYEQFETWLNQQSSQKKITLVDDETLSNDDRLGAIGDLNFVINKEKLNDDLLVIAGDNLFGFSLRKYVDFFHFHKKSQVAFHDLKDREKVKKKFGVGILEQAGTKIINFEEKPEEPKSALAATACYLFRKEDISLIQDLAEHGWADAPGHLIKHLIDHSQAYGFVFDEHWFDIGSLEGLQEAERVYQR